MTSVKHNRRVPCNWSSFVNAEKTYFDSDEDKKAHVHVQQTAIPDKLRQMVDMLVDEEARREEEDVTGVCMEHFLKHNILHYLTTMAEKADFPVGIRGETIRFVSTMINLLDDHFLTQSSIHRPTVRLVRFSVHNNDGDDNTDGQLYHEDLVDLMYTICSKIHGYPALLHIFFYQKDIRTHQAEAEFLLFTYLLKFVHHEGRSGDYARTGLLFIIEMASPDTHPALAEFILTGSDFATNMATGLGGLYSQLPRKLVVINGNHTDEDDSNNSNSTNIAQDMLVFHHGLVADSDGSSNNAEVSTSSAFRSQLDAFLKLLEFCQEVLVRCPNVDICKTLLHHIRSVFLQNILYPSILECTDEDGSSVAVISYIDMILEAVHQDALADMVVSFLINEDDDDSGHCSPASSVIGGNDNNVFVGLELDRIHSSSYFTAAGRFTLKNLISSRLESSSQPAVVAALKLLRTLITKHCNYALKLFSTLPDTDSACPSVSHHRKELELYLELISAIGTNHAHFYHGYEAYLADTEAMLENDGCFTDMQGNHYHHQNSNTTTGMPPMMDDDSYSVTSFGSESTNGNGSTTSGGAGGANKMPRIRRRRSFKKYAQRQKRQEEDDDELAPQNLAFSYYDSHRPTMFKHRMQPTDRLLQILLELLSNFFAQTPELNLALTGVISALALCPYRSLRGWIAFKVTDRASPKDVLVLGKAKHARPTDASEEEDPIYYNPSYDLNTRLKDEEHDDDDDVSVDYGAEKASATQTDPVSFKSFPPFFTLARILTQQIDYYKSDIDDFDKLLAERRRILLRHPSIDYHHQQQQPPYPTPVSTPSPPLGGFFGSWRRPFSSSYTSSSKELPAPAPASNGYWWSGQPDEMMTVSAAAETSAFTTDAIVAHTRHTQDILIVLPFRSKFPAQDTHVAKDMTLSMLLSNVVILEEFIKELVAIMQVRANLGIDPIRYV